VEVDEGDRGARCPGPCRGRGRGRDVRADAPAAAAPAAGRLAEDGAARPRAALIAELVARLAALDLPGCANPYRDEDPELDRPGAAAIRRANLVAYLSSRVGAPYLLVGEAMGYRGGRFSGIAFTSERVLDAWGAPFARSSVAPAGWAEPSATIIHGAIADHEHDVVLWNAVPAHPHRPGLPLTNRPPTVGEVAAGGPFLDLVLTLMAPAVVVAVGRTAERLLGPRAAAAVRHPAQGGATACRAGLAALVTEHARTGRAPEGPGPSGAG
jgi:uracil-DNA glycosylase